LLDDEREKILYNGEIPGLKLDHLTDEEREQFIKDGTLPINKLVKRLSPEERLKMMDEGEYMLGLDPKYWTPEEK